MSSAYLRNNWGPVLESTLPFSELDNYLKNGVKVNEEKILNNKAMLNVNSAIYSAQGVDVNNVAKVSSQILAESAKTPTVQAIDYSKFNRATLGIDLYSSRTNVDLQKQIALTQAGLYAQSVDVAKLNSAAAASLYSAQAVQKQVELTQSVQVAQELTSPKKVEENRNIIKLFNSFKF